jgi:hypothetical protein
MPLKLCEVATGGGKGNVLPCSICGRIRTFSLFLRERCRIQLARGCTYGRDATQRNVRFVSIGAAAPVAGEAVTPHLAPTDIE